MVGEENDDLVGVKRKRECLIGMEYEWKNRVGRGVLKVEGWMADEVVKSRYDTRNRKEKHGEQTQEKGKG